jgi:hypothetical protein
MAKVDFTVTEGGKSRGSGGPTLMSSRVRLSGQDTITTAENIENASGDITLAAGDVFCILADANMRVRFGGVAATATTGHIVPANQHCAFEIDGRDAGTVSAIEAS